MRVTNVTVREMKDKGKLVGMAKVILDDAICIDGLRIINGKDKVHVLMPSRTPKSERDKAPRERAHVTVAYPINREAFDVIYNAVVGEYNRLKA